MGQALGRRSPIEMIMWGGALLLRVFAAQLVQLGPATESSKQDDNLADRAAADTAIWIGSVFPDETHSVSLADHDWWVMDVCEGSTLTIDAWSIGLGAVDMELLTPALHPIAEPRWSEDGMRIQWTSTFTGRVFLKVVPAPEASALPVEYRLRARWADAARCPDDGPAPTAPVPDAGVGAGSPRDQAVVSTSVPPDAYLHDGFLWRLVIGVGVAVGRGGVFGEEDHGGYYYVPTWGALLGGGLDMAFGGSVNESLYLYFDLTSNFPAILGLGFGIGGYLKHDWYIDAAVGYELLIGGYISLVIGKEWWTGQQWLTGPSIRTIFLPFGAYPLAGMTTCVFLNWSWTYN